jgi:hypothetical protein
MKETGGAAVVCFQDVWQAHLEQQDRRRGEATMVSDGSGASIDSGNATTPPAVAAMANEDHHYQDGNDDDPCDVSDVFFELANSPLVGYRLVAGGRRCDKDGGSRHRHRPQQGSAHSTTVVIEQDVSGAIQKHTGGIVWETSYLLLNYLLHRGGEVVVQSAAGSDTRGRTVLEVGAGCGMLGLSLYKADRLGLIGDYELSKNGPAPPLLDRVIVTETGEVMDSLRKNMERNFSSDGGGGDLDEDDNDDVCGGIRQHQDGEPSAAVQEPSTPSSRGRRHRMRQGGLSVCQLDWTTCKEDCDKVGIDAHSIDLLVGTDVVFSTRFVGPLLETIAYLAHAHTVAFLCLQERCRDSHDLLMRTAVDYGFTIQDISDHVYDTVPSCSFGRDLECKILKLTVRATTTMTTVATGKDRSIRSKGEERKKPTKKTKRKRGGG